MHDHVKTTKRASNGTCDCGDVKRNRFYRGKQMRAEEFQAEQNYFVRRRRLISRSVLGWGVVYGFKIKGPAMEKPHPPHEQSQKYGAAGQTSAQTTQTGAPQAPSASSSLVVGPGFALDRCGREVMLVDDWTLGADNTLLLKKDAQGCHPLPIESLARGRYLLSVHYAERQIEDAKLPYPCDCHGPQKKFACETVVFSLWPIEDMPCRCAEPGCKRGCGCDTPRSVCDDGIRSHSCLCEWVTDYAPPNCDRPLCEWNGHWIDPTRGVPLACVVVGDNDDKCRPISFESIEDDSGPRRLVKNNDLLFDLIRGCDLTRIRRVSWGPWHRSDTPMPWETFLEFIGSPPDRDDDRPVTTRFSVDFSGPVIADTVRADCFSLNFLVPSEDTGWLKIEGATIEAVEHYPQDSADPNGTTRGVTLMVSAAWHREVGDRDSIVAKYGAPVQLEVRGDYILDCHGQAIDANARGFALREQDSADIRPSGNGTPGGTLVSMFNVQSRPPKTASRT